MKYNNKGFTLIELIISVAILTIIATACFAFLVTSSRTYASVSAGVNLQTKSQLAMNHIREYIVDSTTLAYFADAAADSSGNATPATLYLLNAIYGADGITVEKYVAHVFSLVGSDIMYSERGVTVTTSTDSTTNVITTTYAIAVATTAELLTDSVTDFSVLFDRDPVDDEIELATIEIDFELSNKQFEGIMEVAPRNQPVWAVVTGTP